MLWATIVRSLQDLFVAEARHREPAKQFLLSEECQSFCKYLRIDGNMFRKIDFEHPEKDIDQSMLVNFSYYY
jgi:hypothetical protein